MSGARGDDRPVDRCGGPGQKPCLFLISGYGVSWVELVCVFFFYTRLSEISHDDMYAIICIGHLDVYQMCNDQ